MALSRALASEDYSHRIRGARDDDEDDDTPSLDASAVAWGAVFAGAAAAAALSLILLILGVGLGLSSVSPWANTGVTASAFGRSTILWLTLTQLLAAALGGYLAGRLRTRWNGVQQDEVYFRDTAHGFLAWAVASLVSAAMLTSAIGSIVGGGVQAGATVAGNAATAATTWATGAGTSRTGSNNEAGPMAYFMDALFRRDTTAAAPLATGTPADPSLDTAANAATPPVSRSAHADSAEMARIFIQAGAAPALAADDLRYAGQMVAQRTGLSQAEAEKRVSGMYARSQSMLREVEAAAKDATDQARKASAHGALWLFVSLLVGAFVASLAATFGGRQRDD